MRAETLTETVPSRLSLTARQAQELRAVGARLASTATWWGAGEADQGGRTVIACEPTSAGDWRVTVRDAIGVVSVAGLQIEVRPKVPLEHFMHLASASQLVPRLDEQHASLALGGNLWELVASWYVAALEAVVRADLIRDYRTEVDRMPVLAGRVVPLATARDYYAGRLRPTCEHQQFDADSPVNRVLKAAAGLVVRVPIGSTTTRKRARRLVTAMYDVSDVRPGDLRARADDRMHHYRDAHLLARQLLTAQLRTPTHGDTLAWSFLLRTPDLIETGVRRILAEELAPERLVSNVGRQLGGSKLRLRPDLVIDDGVAVADIKYKLHSGDWNRPDLYQITAFAAGYQTNRGALICFDDRPDVAHTPPLTIGRIQVEVLSWRCPPGRGPSSAEEDLVNQVRTWLSPA